VSNQWVLFVLNADGTETRLADASFRSGGDFSPDGKQVLYAGSVGGVDGIYVIDADGGTPELVLPAGQRSAGEGCPQGDPCVDGRRFVQASSFAPVFSPDGTQVAFFDGNGDWGHSLRVMNRDGTGVHVVLEDSVTVGVGHVEGLDWSPDGERLVFAIEAGVYVVGTDGSDLVQLHSGSAIPLGVNPYWSPDGSLISFNTSGQADGAYGRFVIVRPDGTPVQTFDYGLSGPWNPR
jgi:Tol biopolymer transport system component